MTAWASQMHPKNCVLPLPLEPILHSPTLAIAGAAVHGAVLSIVLAYWRAGCRALPADEAGLAALSRTYGAQWSRVRQQVKLALAEILPQLESAYERMLRARQARQAIARLGAAASIQKRHEAKLAGAGKSMLAQPAPAMAPLAQHATPYRHGRADMPALAGVARRSAEAQRTGEGGLLRDSGRR
jgi:hypothetical protein